jgi:hypothetical protein
MEVPVGVDLREVAERVDYVGSVEHKRHPSFAGHPRPRADATLCDPALNDPGTLTKWVAEGVRAGQIGAPWEIDFPRYVWVQAEGKWYEARLTNPVLGQYKGYALGEDDDLPPWMAG